MIIHPLTPQVENGELCSAARIELETPRPNMPSTLWFRFPEAEAPLVTERADGFVVALLFLALRLHEGIHLRGTLSPRLAAGMREYLEIHCARNPRLFTPIEITADVYAPTEPSRGYNASALSGGVDSTYTLWTHLAQNAASAEQAVSYAMFVHGLDIGLQDRRTYELCTTGYRRAFGAYGIQLLTPRTNVRRFSSGHSWVWENEVALLGLAHLYGEAFARFYIATSSSFGYAKKGQANPLFDELLSSESLKLFGDGADKTKFQRIETLVHVPATYQCLRVCNVKQDGLNNCGRCDKRLSTMTALELCGVLEKYSTFPSPLDRNRLRYTPTSHFLLNNYKSFLRGAFSQGRYDLAVDIAFKLSWSYFRWGGIWAKRQLEGQM